MQTKRQRTLLGAPGIATSNKKLPAAPGRTTRSKEATRGSWHRYYTGQKKVALVDVETHDNPIPLESYTMRQGKVWAVICHPGKPFIIINLKGCDN